MPASANALLSLLCCVLFAAARLFSGKLRFLEGVPRSRWLSLAGGVMLDVLKEELPEERQSRF